MQWLQFLARLGCQGCLAAMHSRFVHACGKQVLIARHKMVVVFPRYELARGLLSFLKMSMMNEFIIDIFLGSPCHTFHKSLVAEVMWAFVT